MKKRLLYVVGTLLALTTFGANAKSEVEIPEGFPINLDFYYEYEGHTLHYLVFDNYADKPGTKAEVIGMDDAEAPDNYDPDDSNTCITVSIPETVSYEGVSYTVVGVGTSAFRFWEWLGGVNIPSSVTYVGASAFCGCSNLQSINWSGNISRIYQNAFESCISLESIVLPVKLTEIYDKAFRNCRGLKEISFPANLEAIHDKAFEGCSSLESIVLPEKLTRIYDDAFKYCTALKEIYFPANLEAIHNSAFFGCSALEKVEFPSLESMADVQFDYQPLETAHNLYIAGEKVTDLVIPENFTHIRNNAFAGADITSLTLPNTVTSIGLNAFRSCGSLSEVKIPNSVLSIGANAFRFCPISSIVIEEGDSPLDASPVSFPGQSVKKAYIGRPHSSPILRNVTSLESLEIGNCVSEVLDNEFAELPALASLSLGSGLSCVGENAFYGCKALKKVVVPPGVNVVKERAFAASGVEDIAIGYGIRALLSDAFADCPLGSVAITARNVPAVGENVFPAYGWTLLVDGQDSKAAFAASSNFWSTVDSDLLVDPSFIRYDGPASISGKPGDTFDLSALLRPEDVSLPYLFWSSSDPSVATVSTDGVVTLQPGVESISNVEVKYIFIDSMYENTKKIQVRVLGNGGSGVENVSLEAQQQSAIDFAAPYEVYSIDGRRAGNSIDGLAKGIYVIRQGNNSKKFIAR